MTYHKDNRLEKPDVPSNIQEKWQTIVDLMAKILEAPAGLIMKVDPPQIEVFISSKNKRNPYEKGERANFDTGLYCEMVIKQRAPLLVPDALKDPEWDHNPDIKLGMIYYCGFPLEWPGGEIFGTICVLDYKDNSKATAYNDLISEFKQVVEGDLHLILEITERKRIDDDLKKAHNELKILNFQLEDRVRKRTKELGKRTYELHKRVKELNCLNKISSLIEKPDILFEEIIQKTVDLIPSAWQYPEICCARIILKGQEFKTENFKETIWKQSRDIMVYNKQIGTVEVYYLEERPEIDEGPFLKEERSLTNIIAERLGQLIEGKQAEMELQKSYERLQKTMEGTINTITKIVENRDPYTAGHQQRVSKLATTIARKMRLPKDKIEGVKLASLLHDIGKISIPAEILSKPGKLNEMEYSLIKDHSKIGYDILKPIEFTYPVAQIILQHHERIDGSGYPHKLKDDDILLEARIMGVADVIEAMSSHRPYRPAHSFEEVLEEISQNKKVLYDSRVVDVCLRLFKEKSFSLNK